MKYKVVKSEEEWRSKLSPDQYRVLREKGTEAPYTGKFNLHKEDGFYVCGACGDPLFDSEAKYDSGCGWPAFFKPLAKDKIEYKLDKSHGMVRTEILCANCGGHLGHVFNDGPEPTGERYCVNSLSLDFDKKENED